MSRLDDLPPDQRAALSLLLGQGKAYAEVAALLGIGERAVHDRAHAALAVLAPREARGLAPERREEIGDYLLGQSDGLADRLRMRSLLDGSPAAQAWARAIADELAPLASGPLPEIPDGAGPASGASGDGEVERPQSQPAASVAGRAPESVGARAVGSARLSAGHAAAQLPSSRVGGAILLAAIAAVVIAVVLLNSGGGSHHARSSATRSTSGASTTPRASETRRLTLTAPNSASKALGVAAVLQEGSTYAFYLAAERLAPSRGFFYAVWLYNSPSSYEALSKSPPVGSDGRLQGGALLPTNAGNYHHIVVTRETSQKPASPGPIVLRGDFGLH